MFIEPKANFEEPVALIGHAGSVRSLLFSEEKSRFTR
jgi:hypothetical protein